MKMGTMTFLGSFEFALLACYLVLGGELFTSSQARRVLDVNWVFFRFLNSASRVNYSRNLNRHSVLFDALNQFELWGHSWNFHLGEMCQNHLTFAAAPHNIFRWHRNDRFLLNPQNIGNNKLQNKKTNNNNITIRKIQTKKKKKNIFFSL